MNRFRLLAIGMLLVGAVAAPARQTATGPAGTDKDGHARHPAQSAAATVEQQLKILTAKLDLTGDQQTRMKPILQELHDATQKLVQEKSLSRDERLAQARPHLYKADKQMREILSDDQKNKLDQYEQEPHPEMHGGLSGTTP